MAKDKFCSLARNSAAHVKLWALQISLQQLQAKPRKTTPITEMTCRIHSVKNL